MKFATTALAAMMILTAPWPIGGNYLFVRTIVLVLAAILGIAAALSCLVEQKRFKTSILWLVLPLVAGYAIFQTLDVSGPISISPSASRAQLYDLASAFAIFFSSTVLFREKKTIEPLMICLAVVGVAVAFVGVVQNLGWNGKVLWVYELLFGGTPFGPFVNSNNAAGFLILTLAGAFYCSTKPLLKNIKSSRSEATNSTNFWGIKNQDAEFDKTNSVRNALRLFANLETRHLYCLSAIIAIIAGIFLSYSRGGSISAAMALTVGMIMLMMKNRWAIVLSLLVFVSCLGVAVWVEQVEAVQESLISITETTEDTDPRLLHWKDALPYYQTYWQTGSGLGTYRYEYPIFQQHEFAGKFVHAENVFLETLAELGIVGVLAIAITCLVILSSCIALFRQRNSHDRALGISGTIAITGLIAASCFDFGIYQPANFIVAAILFGAVIGRACHPDCRFRETNSSLGFGKHFRFAIVLLLILVAGYSVLPSAAIESRQLAKRQIAIHVKRTGGESWRIEEAEKALTFAEKFLPQDWQTQYLLGQCEVYRHRDNASLQLQTETESVLQLRADEEGWTDEQIESQFPKSEEYWATTSLINMHRMLRIVEAQNLQQYKLTRKDPSIKTVELERAWARFRHALELCDRSEKVHFRLAQMTALMEPTDNNKEIESTHLKNALELAKGYSGLNFSAGLLSMHSGNYEFAAELWAKCLSKSRAFERRIVLMGVELPAKLFFENVLPQNPNYLLHLSGKYFKEPDQKLPKEFLLVHTRRLIERSDLDDIEKQSLTGRAYFQAGQFRLACEQFELALDSEPNCPVWRLDYSKCLVEIGRFDDAIRELKICQLEDPDSAVKLSRMIDKVKRDRIRERTNQVRKTESDSNNLNTLR